MRFSAHYARGRLLHKYVIAIVWGNTRKVPSRTPISTLSFKCLLSPPRLRVIYVYRWENMNYGATKIGADAVSVRADDTSSSSSSSGLAASPAASRSPGSNAGSGSEAEGPSLPPRDDEENGEEQQQQKPWRYRTWDGLKGFYRRNIGLFFVFLAQTFGSIVRTCLLTAYPRRYSPIYTLPLPLPHSTL